MRVLLRHSRHIWTGGMLVGKDQHVQASGRGRKREEKQAGTLQDHQGREGGRRNRQGHCRIIITGRHARGNLKARHYFPLPKPPRLGLDLLLRWNPRPPPSAARALPPRVALSALDPAAPPRVSCAAKSLQCWSRSGRARAPRAQPQRTPRYDPASRARQARARARRRLRAAPPECVLNPVP